MHANTQNKQIFFECSTINTPSKIEELKRKEKLILLGKKRFCTCSKSKCSKKYCECFNNSEKCNPDVCSCFDCQNNFFNKKKEIKIGTYCSCNKSQCSKKYCECFTRGKKCNLCCTCINCKNKKIFNTVNYFFMKCKKILIKNENIIIDNYQLIIQSNLDLDI